MVLQCDAGSRKSPIFILEKGIIMDISSILWGFIASYLAGSLPSLREFISTKDKTTLDERIEQCYQTALGRWCANDAVRQRIAQKHFNDLKQVKKLYLTERGKLLLSHARDLVSQFEQLEELMLSQGQNERFQLGTTLTVGTCLAPTLIGELEETLPGLEVYSFVRNTHEIEEKLLKSDLD